MAQNVAAIFFEPVFRSYGGEGPVEALQLSNEELKRQLAPQGGRTQVIFSMFVLSKNTHQNGPNKFLLWAFRSFEYLLVPVWVWGSPCCYAARCENLAHDLRNLWVRNQALPETRNEIRKSKTWTNTKSSMVQDAQKCDAMRWTTCWPLARSSDRWIEVVICCDMDYENEHDGDHGLNEGSNSFQDSFAGVMYADPDRNWRRRSPLTRPLRCLELDWEVWQLAIACTLTLVIPTIVLWQGSSPKTHQEMNIRYSWRGFASCELVDINQIQHVRVHSNAELGARPNNKNCGPALPWVADAA